METNHLIPTVPFRPHPQTKGQERPVTSGRQIFAQDATMSVMGIDRTAPASTTTTTRLHSSSKPRTSQQSGFSALNDETKVRILSLLPAQTVVSRCRAICQELPALIDGHGNRIAHTIAKRELLRLQDHSDKLKAFGPPANIIDFVEGLRFFTAQRGIVTYKKHGPLVARWLLHLFRNVFSAAENPVGHEVRWDILARAFLQLQGSCDDDIRRGIPKRDYRQKFTQIVVTGTMFRATRSWRSTSLLSHHLPISHTSLGRSTH